MRGIACVEVSIEVRLIACVEVAGEANSLCYVLRFQHMHVMRSQHISQHVLRLDVGSCSRGDGSGAGTRRMGSGCWAGEVHSMT